MSTRKLFEQVKDFVDAKNAKTGALVANLKGVVETVPAIAQPTTSQGWYVVNIETTTFPSLREFVDAHSYQRLPVEEAASIEGRASYPESGAIPTGRAVAFAGAIHAAGPTGVPIDITAPGHQLAVYLDEQIVTSGAGGVTATLSLTEGTHHVLVLAFGGTTAIRVELPPEIGVLKREPTPPAPILSGEPEVEYLHEASGVFVATPKWHNDAYASGWEVYRCPSAEAGAVTAARDLGSGRFAVDVTGDYTDLPVGAPLFVGKFFAGDVALVEPGVDADEKPIATITLRLGPDAPTTPADWTDKAVLRPTGAFQPLAHLANGGQRVVEYPDAAVKQGLVYLYQITALGWIVGVAESDYSQPGYAIVDDHFPPGDITFDPETDVKLVNGELILSYHTPADADYAGVKVYLEDPDDGHQILLTSELGEPDEDDQLRVRLPMAATYRFRTYDTAGNVQAADEGVTWAWDGKSRWINAVHGLLTAIVDDAAGTAALKLEVLGPEELFPVDVRFFVDQLDTPLVLDDGGTPDDNADDVTSYRFDAPGTVDAATLPALGDFALPLSGNTHFWAELTDVEGSITFDATTADRGAIPGGFVDTEDYTAFPSVVMGYDEDVQRIVLTVPTEDGTGVLGTVEWTRAEGGGLDPDDGGTVIYDVGSVSVVPPGGGALTREHEIPTDQARGTYVVEYFAEGPAVKMWEGKLHGPASNPPTVNARLVLDDTMKDAVDVYVTVESPVEEDVTLQMRDEDDPSLPVWTLVLGDQQLGTKYVASGTELGPGEFFKADLDEIPGGTDGPDPDVWSQKLNNRLLLQGQIKHIALRAVGKDSGVKGQWQVVALPVKEVPVVSGVDLVFDEAAKTLVLNGTAGEFCRSAIFEIGTDETFATAAARTEVDLETGTSYQQVYSVQPADYGKRWFGRVSPYNGALTPQGHVSGFGGFPLRDSEFIGTETASGDVSLTVDEAGVVAMIVLARPGALSFRYVASKTAQPSSPAGGTAVDFAGAATVPVGNLITLQPGETAYVTVWFYAQPAGAGDATQPVARSITFRPAPPPVIDTVLQTRTSTTDIVVDFSIRVSDSLGRGGTFKAWTNPGGRQSANPNGAPDCAIPVAFSPITITPGMCAALGNVLGSAAEDKHVYFEFIVGAGASAVSSGKKDWKVSSRFVDIDDKGKLNPGVVDLTNLVAGLQAVRVVTALPATGTDGEMVQFQGITYTWYQGKWNKSLEIDDLLGKITDDFLAAKSVDLTKVADGLTMVSIVSTLPAAKTSEVVFLSTDAKLYRWDGTAGKYTKAVTQGDLAADTVVAGTVAAGAINTRELVADAVKSNIIASDQILGRHVVTKTLTANHVQVARLEEFATNLGIQVSGKLFSTDLTKFIDLGASGTQFFISTPNFYVQANGTAFFNGTLGASAIGAIRISATQVIVNSLQEFAQNMGIMVTGKLQGQNTGYYLNLNATPGATVGSENYYFIKTPNFEVRSDGSALFTGTVTVTKSSMTTAMNGAPLADLSSNLGVVFAGMITTGANWLDLRSGSPSGYILFHQALRLLPSGGAEFMVGNGTGTLKFLDTSNTQIGALIVGRPFGTDMIMFQAGFVDALSIGQFGGQSTVYVHAANLYTSVSTTARFQGPVIASGGLQISNGATNWEFRVNTGSQALELRVGGTFMGAFSFSTGRYASAS
jgi:hypothetical protein